MTGKIYDSWAISEERWKAYARSLILDGWELVSVRNGLAYIRREFYR